MQRILDGWHSPSLNRHMEIVTYGHYGQPILMFPTAAADYLEYERFQLIDAVAEHIESGKVKLFSINSINSESWLNPRVPPRHMALRQVQYNGYIVDEVVPYIWNSCRGRVGIITCGASLGAYHCANQFFRRPDLFDGMLAMSGGYDIRSYFHGDYHDDNVYFNNPIEYLPNLNDEGVLNQLRAKRHIHILTGQGSYENPASSRRLSAILASKGIAHNLDLWGYDMPHDWPTWRAMMRYYLADKL